ncbi:hypothetical protein OOK31_12245 [Streptomyces sp. NBC_00249]|uniref:hypothetical protein n=1 Tax=Streptomyces sp. NBC_00249 TaxID=2975690 RepID=UPI00225804EC|nr:hypothetical protein [Streptomyces sp. NBC_00249]MCX5194657.1 hypothetical protein [Streptomyces sp. NBC_00249]
MKTRTRTRVLAGSVAAGALFATLIGAAPAPAAPAAPARPAAVHGGASVLYAYSPRDDIRFTVEAVAAPFTRPFPGKEGKDGSPTDARGKVTVYHYSPEYQVTGTSEAEVDCLVTGGRTATVTAVVTKSTVGDVGRRIGISVQDGVRGEPDRLGFSWGVANIDPPNLDPDGSVAKPSAGTCMAPAPFTEVTKGGFKVVPAPLPPLPKA